MPSFSEMMREIHIVYSALREGLRGAWLINGERRTPIMRPPFAVIVSKAQALNNDGLVSIWSTAGVRRGSRSTSWRVILDEPVVAAPPEHERGGGLVVREGYVPSRGTVVLFLSVERPALQMWRRARRENDRKLRPCLMFPIPIRFRASS